MFYFIHTRSSAPLKTFALSLDGKLQRFVTKKWKKQLPNSSQTDYSIAVHFSHAVTRGPPYVCINLSCM